MAAGGRQGRICELGSQTSIQRWKARGSEGLGTVAQELRERKKEERNIEKMREERATWHVDPLPRIACHASLTPRHIKQPSKSARDVICMVL